jgi:3-methylcrotonyl-CoA carboxylase alpha subunit
MDKLITITGETTELQVEREGTTVRAGEYAIELVAVRENEAELRIGNRTHVVPFVVQGTTVSFAFEGEVYSADVADKGSRPKSRSRDQSTSAPMPGVVLKIMAAVGDVVTKGAPLLVLEAMKMEHQIVAPRDGKIAAVNCREGDMVQPGVELVTFEETA